LEAARIKKDFQAMLELFESHQPDYDIWDFNNEQAYTVFMENF